ncbi:MAG TPA: DUF692 domain-containing protein [Steroidobacteraceae bacterium]|nr:DUF692 domain-containing protein [Steroidobacteraceae bacterium]
MDPLPARAGVGLKPKHYAAVLDSHPSIGFFEVHAENYMGAGGPPHRYLTAIRERYPLSLHGVGLSIGGPHALDRDHLQRLRALIERYEPGAFSEHLAWSTHGAAFLDDLLPLPYTDETLHCVVRHVEEVQEALGRPMLLENPSTYVAFAESTWPEADFIGEVARRTGCALLLDVNNAFVSCTNQQCEAGEYLDRFPAALVHEIHLAGHFRDTDDEGRPLLIDTHDREVAESVWMLYARLIARIGPVPTLIEWDAQVPEWTELEHEASRADSVLLACGSTAARGSRAARALEDHAAVG